MPTTDPTGAQDRRDAVAWQLYEIAAATNDDDIADIVRNAANLLSGAAQIPDPDPEPPRPSSAAADRMSWTSGAGLIITPPPKDEP